jgi:pimeloyl-ACP methyl ester carboxylesterase
VVGASWWSALGADSTQWHAVIERLTTHPQVITYDRPGIGRSQPRPAPNPPRPYRRFADELATMLPRLGVSGAVVAVGHSFGSLIIQSFAARHPDRVAGMVHIDASLPGMALWPDYGPLVDGHGTRATTIDADLGAAELAGDRLPQVPTVVIARTPGRWRSPAPTPPSTSPGRTTRPTSPAGARRRCSSPPTPATTSPGKPRTWWRSASTR